MSDNDNGFNQEVATWQPPWQREGRPDSPGDEPVGEHDEYADALSQESPSAIPEPAEVDHPVIASIPVEDESDLGAILEAILMISAEPVTDDFLSSVLERPPSQIQETLQRLSAEYTGDGRGFDLRRGAGGWRFYTRADYAKYVERFVTDGASARLSKAALETLAVVAYRQPVTRGRISAVRGVNCDGVIRTLLTRGMIEECGTDPDSPATLYQTTTLFLEKMGLESVDQLPDLAPFLPDDVKDLDEHDESTRQ